MREQSNDGMSVPDRNETAQTAGCVCEDPPPTTAEPRGIYQCRIGAHPGFCVNTERKASFGIVRTTRLSDAKDVLCGEIGEADALVVIDGTVFRFYQDRIKELFDGFPAPEKIHFLTLEAHTASGEKKTAEELLCVINAAAECGLSRKGYFIAIGGGVTLDIVGLAAQLYRRMVRYVRIPTTLVGQIDAGVGIKVGINHLEKKNLLGAFYPPRLVVNANEFLFSLSEEDFTCGICEMLKAGIADCPELVSILQNGPVFTPERIRTDRDSAERFGRAMDLAVYTMLGNLSDNLFEENGLKRLMDFGHTFSPQIESSTEYHIPHGFAVAIDMYISILLSEQLGLLTEAQCDTYLRLFDRYGLLRYWKEIRPKTDQVFQTSIRSTVLHRGGSLNLVIPTGYGKAGYLDLATSETRQDDAYAAVLSQTRLKALYDTAVLRLEERKKE